MNPDLEKQMAAADAAMAATGETQPPPPGADGRAATSPINGAKGGRPGIDWGAVAGDYQMHYKTTVRYSKGAFYEYDPDRGAYRIATRDEEGARVGAFLKSDATPILYTVNAERNLLGALKGNRDNLSPPCFADTGASAAGWAAMRNGLLDIEAAARGESGALIGHTPNFFSSRYFPFVWDPTAPCPRFSRFLVEVLPDEESRNMAEMLAGLLLVPETCYNVFFVFLGDGGCGKSTLLKILAAMLGEDNTCSVPLWMMVEKHTSHRLTRTLANLVDDSPTVDSGRGQTLSGVEGLLKEVTSGAKIHCEPKGVDAWEAPATARCVFCQNPPLPPFVDRSEAIWDRLRVIPFPMRFRGTAEQNPRLAEEIIAEELPGVFALAVRGLGRLRQLKLFPQCKGGAEIIAEHRGLCDHEKTFLVDRYAFTPGSFTPSGVILRAYKDWCENEGFTARGGRNFAADVRRVFPQVWLVNRRWMGRMTRGFQDLAEIPEEEE
jgi:P4 family phage/plasmid primase-like protien